MADLIDRQAAIDAIRKDMYADKDWMSAVICDGIEQVLKRLPSAQPDVPDTNVGDLISRQAAYEVLTAYYHHRTDIQHAALHDALNRVPTARARWEHVDYGGVGNWHCSACRAISLKRTNFCPACGRDMRGDYQ